jgi:hypothetical protein
MIRKLSAVPDVRATLAVFAQKPVSFLFVAGAVVVHAALKRLSTGVRRFGWLQQMDWKAGPRDLPGADGETVL